MKNRFILIALVLFLSAFAGMFSQNRLNIVDYFLLLPPSVFPLEFESLQTQRPDAMSRPVSSLSSGDGSPLWGSETIDRANGYLMLRARGLMDMNSFEMKLWQIPGKPDIIAANFVRGSQGVRLSRALKLFKYENGRLLEIADGLVPAVTAQDFRPKSQIGMNPAFLGLRYDLPHDGVDIKCSVVCGADECSSQYALPTLLLRFNQGRFLK